jgi:hypothetical protein
MCQPYTLRTLGGMELATSINRQEASHTDRTVSGCPSYAAPARPGYLFAISKRSAQHWMAAHVELFIRVCLGRRTALTLPVPPPPQKN